MYHDKVSILFIFYSNVCENTFGESVFSFYYLVEAGFERAGESDKGHDRPC